MKIRTAHVKTQQEMTIHGTWFLNEEREGNQDQNPVVRISRRAGVPGLVSLLPHERTSGIAKRVAN
jgi:hypothetical protein